MKNIFKFLFALSVVFITSCDNDPDLRMPTIDDGFLPRIDINDVDGSGLVDLNDLDNVVFVMDLGIEDDFTKTTAKNYDLVVKYDRDDRDDPYQTAVILPNVSLGEVSVTIDELVSALGINKAGLTLGQVFTFALDVELNSGKKIPAFIDGNLTYSASVFSIPNASPIANYPVACVSNVIPGAYGVVSNGTNTDGQPAAVNHPYDVTITKTGATSYDISDGVAGVYILWYSVYGYTFETTGNFNDVCGALSGTWQDAFGSTINITGTDNGDGTLSISWTNGFGDKCDAVYTLK